jgi:hypothetical protein
MAEIIVSQAPSGLNSPQANFDKNRFDVTIWQKGYDVLHEKALQCPCKSRNTNQLSSCKNCGGTGWVFINPTKTRMILQSINMSTKYKEWSQENLGTVSVTCRDTEELAFMDKITIIEGESVFNEVLHSKKTATKLFFYSTYKIKQILYIGLYQGATSTFKILKETIDYTFDKNKIVLDDSYIVPLTEDQDSSVTVRYVHSPEFHIIDMPRDTINTNVTLGGVETTPVYLPIHGIGRRIHYVLDMQNFNGTRLLDNSYDNCEYPASSIKKIC